MRTMDWVGLGLVLVVGAGGVFYFVKMRPLNPGAQAQVGTPVPVIASGQNFVQPQGQQPQPGSTTANDVTNIIGAVGGLAGQLFPNGIGGLFGGN